MNLGDFGAAMRELDRSTDRDTFTFLGETFTVASDIPPMLMLQLGASATGKIDDSEGLAAMWQALAISLTVPEHTGPDGKVVPEDTSHFNRFYKIGLRADLDSIMTLVFALFQAQDGRPTVAAPASSGGLPPTSPSSSSSSSPPVSSPAVLTAAPRPLDSDEEPDRSAAMFRSLDDILTAG